MRHDRVLRVQPIGRLLEYPGLWPVDHIVRDLLPPIGWQAMQVSGAGCGLAHHALIDAPVTMRLECGAHGGLIHRLTDARREMRKTAP
jgi:hypothetical protein